MDYAGFAPTRLVLVVAALTVFAAWNVAPAAASISIGPSNGVLKVTGDGQNDSVQMRVSKTDPSLLEFDVNNDKVFDGTVPLGTFKSMQFTMGAGDDRVQIDDSGGTFTDTKPTDIQGGDGADRLIGGAGAENLIGGAGDDLIWGGRGRDAALADDGDDRFLWQAGDGTDLMSGGAGSDIAQIRGTDSADGFGISPQGASVRVFRNIDGSFVDMLQMEALDMVTFGGDDLVAAAPDVGAMIKLTIAAGSTTGPDDDIVKGSDSADVLSSGVGNDRLEGRGGDDTIEAGDGDDALLGGTGKDALTGGAGADSFECDTVGEALDLGSGDFTQGTCTAPNIPPASEPPATQPPVTQPAPAGMEPAGLGFARPVVRATREGLRATLRNTSASALRASLKVSERFPRSSRTLRYRLVTKTIPAGGRVAIRLRAPAALRARIARRLDRLGRVTRRPTVTVTNIATAGRLSVRPRLTLRTR